MPFSLVLALLREHPTPGCSRYWYYWALRKKHFRYSNLIRFHWCGGAGWNGVQGNQVYHFEIKLIGFFNARHTPLLSCTAIYVVADWNRVDVTLKFHFYNSQKCWYWTIHSPQAFCTGPGLVQKWICPSLFRSSNKFLNGLLPVVFIIHLFVYIEYIRRITYGELLANGIGYNHRYCFIQSLEVGIGEFKQVGDFELL